MTRRRTDHVLLFSIDGLRPEIYRDERWPAPVLQQLARDGAFAVAVRSVFPALTYPAHATLVTGVLPARHGIVHNEEFRSGAESGRWLWNASAIRAPNLWDAVRARGGTTAAVSWPVTVGAAIDWNVPDIWLPGNTMGIASIRNATTPPGLFEELEREATGRLTDESFSVDYVGREDIVGAMAAYLFARYRPTISFIHIIGLDHVRHRLGLDNPAARRAVAAADRAIGRVLETVERLALMDHTTVIVTGDHGGIDVHTALCPNVWLRDAGLLSIASSSASWTMRFRASGGSAFLRLEKSDADALRNLAAVRDVLRALPVGVRRLFRSLEREELDRYGADPDAALALAAIPGVVFDDALDGPAIRPAHGAGHGYDPELPGMMTGFVAGGAGIRAGAVAPLLAIEDVVPLIAALLGLEMSDIDGVLLPGLLSSGS